MSEDNLTRRRMLQLTGSAAAIGLAGCAGAPASDGQNQAQAADESHTETEAAEESHDDSESGHGEEEEGHSDEEEGHGEDGHGHDEAVGSPTDTAEVKMVTTDNGYHFEPHVVRVNVGGTVTFHNESGTHSTTAYHPDNDQPQLVPDGQHRGIVVSCRKQEQPSNTPSKPRASTTTTALPTKRSA
ncbi:MULTISPECIES: hypothetical protein [Haloferax]|uniref:cupredoxin domain-containing protein n=1 Tax=Haloferax TaxID=2251 RepID=UPI002B40043B|nr:hypothetical protein [Haloferax marinisediminis]